MLQYTKAPNLSRLGAFLIITQNERLQLWNFKSYLQIKFYTLSQGQTRGVIDRIGLATHIHFPGIGTGFTTLPGVSAQVSIKVKDSKLPATGPLLIALGVSGPAILKLSAWGARILHDKNYQFTIFVNWLNDVATKDAEKMLKELKQEQAKKAVSKKLTFDFPNRLWKVWFSHRVLKVKPNRLIYPKSNCKTWPINWRIRVFKSTEKALSKKNLWLPVESI